jgi:hypothetical protein
MDRISKLRQNAFFPLDEISRAKIVPVSIEGIQGDPTRAAGAVQAGSEGRGSNRLCTGQWRPVLR